MRIARNHLVADTRLIASIVTLSLALLCGGCAGNSTRHAPSKTAGHAKQQVQVSIQQQDPHPKDKARLAQAVQLIKRGDMAKAVQGPIAKILAHFPARTEKGNTRYFSAQTMVEMILYSGVDQGKHSHIVVMPGEWVTALFLEGFAYNSTQQFADARKALTMGAAIAPFNAHLLNELGFTYEQLKNWPQAMDTFKNAESAADFLDGKDKIVEKTRAIRGQGYVLVELDKLDAAEAAYHRALKLDPGDVTSMGQLHYVEQLRKMKH